MSGPSKIEWTEHTWNPTRGCSRVSPGCEHCYAERFESRGLTSHRSPTTGEAFAIFQPGGPRWTGKVELIPDMLGIPLRRKKPTMYFVNSMSDLFHESLKFSEIALVFGAMAAADWHTYQVLTKRHERMRQFYLWLLGCAAEQKKYTVNGKFSIRDWLNLLWLRASPLHNPLPDTDWPFPHVWMGVSVENQKYADERIPLLLQTPAAVRFISAEPLLGPIDFKRLKMGDDLRLLNLDWVIVGGESGPGARPCNTEWVRSIVLQCRAAGVPVFVKQLGAHVIQGGARRIKKNRKGGDVDEWEHDLRVREMPRPCTAP